MKEKRLFLTSLKQTCNEYLIKFSENRKKSPCSPCAPNLLHVLVSRILGYHNLCGPALHIAEHGNKMMQKHSPLEEKNIATEGEKKVRNGKERRFEEKGKRGKEGITEENTRKEGNAGLGNFLADFVQGAASVRGSPDISANFSLVFEQF